MLEVHQKNIGCYVGSPLCRCYLFVVGGCLLFELFPPISGVFLLPFVHIVEYAVGGDMVCFVVVGFTINSVLSGEFEWRVGLYIRCLLLMSRCLSLVMCDEVNFSSFFLQTRMVFGS